MFGPLRIKNKKPAPKKQPSSSRFAFIRMLTDKCYRDPYCWGLCKGLLFFAGSVCAIRIFSDLELLPSEGPQDIQSPF